jgi:hypothetical protein
MQAFKVLSADSSEENISLEWLKKMLRLYDKEFKDSVIIILN